MARFLPLAVVGICVAWAAPIEIGEQMDTIQSGADLLETAKTKSGSSPAKALSPEMKSMVAGVGLSAEPPDRPNQQLGGVLVPGIDTAITVPAVQTAGTLLDGDSVFQFEVPASAERMQVDLIMEDPALDVDLYLRFGSAPALNGSTVTSDALALSPFGYDSIALSRETNPALRSGTYFLALRVRTAGQAGAGVLRLTLGSESFRGVELTADQPMGFIYPPQSSPTLYTGDLSHSIVVPEEATALTIRSAFNSQVNIDMFVRFGQAPAIGAGPNGVASDHRALTTRLGGAEEIRITPQSNPPLRPGRYFIAQALFTRNQLGYGLIVARLEGVAPPTPGPGPGSSTLQSTSAASFEAGPIARNSIVTSFGSGLTAGGSEAVTTLPLPINVAGTTLQLFDSAGREGFMPIFFAGPRQVNWLMPDWPSNGPARVIVRTSNATEVQGTIEIVDVAPSLFFVTSSAGQKLAAANIVRVASSGGQSTAATFDCAQGCRNTPVDLTDRQQRYVVSLFATGVRAQSSISAMIDNQDLPVLGAAAQSQFEGLDQVNIELIPDRIPDGVHQIKITANGMQSNVVVIQTVNGAPPPPPSISSVSSSEIRQGETAMDFTVTGSNLAAVTEARLSPPDGIVVSNLRASDSQVQLSLSVAQNAPTGQRMLTLISRGGTSNALPVTVTLKPAGSPPTLTAVTLIAAGTEFNAQGITGRFILARLTFRDPDGDVVWTGNQETSGAIETSLSGGACTFRTSAAFIGTSTSTASRTVTGELRFPASGTVSGSAPGTIAVVDAAGNVSNRLTANLPFSCQ